MKQRKMDFALALHCLQNKELKQERNTEHDFKTAVCAPRKADQ
jgi:hypothetical protein